MAPSHTGRLSRARLKRESRPCRGGFAQNAHDTRNDGCSDRHPEQWGPRVALVNALAVVIAVVATASQARAFLREGTL